MSAFGAKADMPFVSDLGQRPAIEMTFAGHFHEPPPSRLSERLDPDFAVCSPTRLSFFFSGRAV